MEAYSVINTYYHKIPECPDCGSPLINAETVKYIKSNNYYICSDECDCHIFNSGIPWRIRFNRFENIYADWIINEMPENTLTVTWPFSNPEIFSTILCYEYTLKNKKNALIVTPENYTIQGTEIPLNELPEYIFVQSDKASNCSENMDKKALFPKVSAYSYSIPELKINGRIHAGNINGFKKKISGIYGVEYTNKIKMHSKDESRFGKLKIYDISDMRDFCSHVQNPLDELISENVIFHTYNNIDMLNNYIEKYDPGIIIFTGMAGPFTDSEQYRNLHKDGRTVILLGVFSKYELNRIMENTGKENITTLKSFEFLDNIDDESIYSHGSNGDIPEIKIQTYATAPEIELTDVTMNQNLKRIIQKAQIILTPANLVGVDDHYGIDDIINELHNDNEFEYRKFCEYMERYFHDTDSNPWTVEIAEFIKNNNLDHPDNCVIAGYRSGLEDIFRGLGLKLIKIIKPNKITKSEYNTIIMTWLPKNLDPEILDVKRMIFFTNERYGKYIDNFFRYRKYLENTNYYIYNDKNMPADIAEIMRKIDNKKIEVNDMEIRDIEISTGYNNNILSEYGGNIPDEGTREQYRIAAGERALFLYDIDNNCLVIPENTEIYVMKSTMLRVNTGDKDILQKIHGSWVPLDVSGFYTSIKAGITYFLMQNSDMIKINGMRFNMAYKLSKIWIDELSNLSRTKKDIAHEISIKLDITARNEYYISTWWRLIESYNGFYIYRTERPKSLHDMIQIFNYIRDLTKDDKFDINLAIRCYNACTGIQRVRNNLLHGKYPFLQESLNSIIESLEGNGKKFYVSQASFKTTENEINAMIMYRSGEI